MVVYLIGSLRSPRVPSIGNSLRERGYDIFDDWHAGGPTADDEWQRYEKARGRTYKEALKGYAARHVFEYDVQHLKRADAVVLVLPAGKSGHLELGWALGAGKPGFILLEEEEPERWDVMNLFATAVCGSLGELVEELEAVRAWFKLPVAPWSSDR